MTDKTEPVTKVTEDATQYQETWKPEKTDVIILTVLILISLMAALDSTVLVTILPVSCWTVVCSCFDDF